jgi:hypothetical protein
MKLTLRLLCLLFVLMAAQSANAVSIQVDSIKHVQCYGQQTGAIYITVVTDTFYSVTWINVAPSHIVGIHAINLYAGTYEVRANAFDGTQATLFITVEEPPLLEIEVLEQYPPDCRGNNGFISVQAVGGAPGSFGYTYNWGNGYHGTTQIVPFPGAYFNLSVTDGNGCDTYKDFSAVPEYPFFRMDSNTLRQINCYNRVLWLREDEPVLLVQKNIDFDPVSYHWTATNGGNILSNPDSSAILLDAAGRYTIVVTNEANGCAIDALAIVTVDTLAPLADAGPDKFLYCPNSRDTLLGFIAGPPNAEIYGYWDGPHIIEYLPDTGVVIGGTGAYTLIAINSTNGCKVKDTTLVTSLNEAPAIATAGGIIGCLSDTTTITAIFDTLNTHFEGWFIEDTLFSTARTLIVTEPTTFLLLATDSETGCGASTYAFVYVDTFPPQLEFYNDSLFCNTPLVQIHINELYTAPEDTIYYAFTWSGPQGFTSTAAEPWVTSAGVYSLLLTYLPSGCTNTLVAEVLSDDHEPPVLTLQNANLYLNENGLAVLSPDQVAVGSTDACGSITEWLLEPAIFDCSIMGENTVSVTAYDQNGNSAAGTVQVTVLDTLSPTLICPDNIVRGYCDAQVIFGIPNGIDNCLITGNLEAQQFGGLPSGAQFPIGTTVQRFVVHDGPGNSAICSFSVTVLPPLADVNASLTIPSCSGSCDGQIVLETNGGTPPFQYLWNTGGTNSLLTNVCAGNYVVTVTDSQGCTSQWITNLTEPSLLTVVIDTVINDSNNQGLGAITITASGGTPPYQFNWAFEDVSFSNNEDLDSLFEGTYSCQIFDANNCLASVVDIVVDNLVATQEAGWKQAIHLSPNPTTGWTTILLPAGLSEKPLIHLFDVTGKLMSTATIPMSEQIWMLDMGPFPSGVYQVQVISRGQVATLQLVKVSLQP